MPCWLVLEMNIINKNSGKTKTCKRNKKEKNLLGVYTVQ